MSLLEDVFLEDEAGEARELERVIEGDEVEDRPRSDSDENSEKEDEATEDKRRVDPNSTKTRIVKNPRFILNPARLTGPRGIQILPEHFKDFKFKGKGHECDDLDLVLKKLEHWAYRLYPKFSFEDCLKKIETLGKKRPVMVHLQKIRSDQLILDDTVVQKDSSDEEAPAPDLVEDEFDKLLQQQIDLARATPAPGSARKAALDDERSPFSMPKVTSSPSISEEQKQRMMRNRMLAEEKRLARLKQSQAALTQDTSHSVDLTKEVIPEVNETHNTKHNRSNVIQSDSSDDECNVTALNDCVTADVHVNNSDVLDKDLFNNVKEKLDECKEGMDTEVNVDNGRVIRELDVCPDPDNNDFETENASNCEAYEDSNNIEPAVNKETIDIEMSENDNQ